MLGVEYQSTIDQKMVVRTRIYEMLDYYNQLISGRKKLMPNIMIVFMQVLLFGRHPKDYKR